MTIKKITQILESKKFEFALLILIILAGFVVRLYKIESPIADWHSWRQADTASVTRNYVSNGINLLLPKFDDISSIQSRLVNLNGYRMVEFPFYNAISAILYNTTANLTGYGNQYFSIEVWSRLVTIFCAIVSAIILYFIGKRYLGSWGGILSAFFYLFIPFNIYFTRVILPDPMGVMFGLFGLLAFIRYIDEKGLSYLYISALFFAAMLLIKPYLGFYLFPVVYLALTKFSLKNIYTNIILRRQSILFFFIIIIPFILWRWWESNYPEGIPLFWWAFNGNGIRFKPAYWNWVFGERLGHLILGSLGVIPFVFGILTSKNKNYFIQWYLFGTLFYLILVANANVMHDYYQILTIPSIALSLASGSIYLWNQFVFNKLLTRVILVFSIVVMLITGWFQVRGNYIINHFEIIEAGQAVDKLTPKDAIVVAPYNGDTAFLYQTKRRGWPAVDNSIDNIIKQGASYYVSVDLNSTDTLNFEKRFPTLVKTKNYIILKLI